MPEPASISETLAEAEKPGPAFADSAPATSAAPRPDAPVSAPPEPTVAAVPEPVRKPAPPEDDASAASTREARADERSPVDPAGIAGPDDAPSATAASPRGSPDGAAGAPDTAATAINAYVSTLHRLIDLRKVYPRSSEIRGEEGTVVLRLTLDAGGGLLAVRVDAPGPEALVDASFAAVERAASEFPPFPAALAGGRADFIVLVVFRLD